MTKTSTPEHSPAFKAKVALAALKGEKTLVELAQQSTCTSTKSRNGKHSFARGCRSIWVEQGRLHGTTVDLKALHAKIGELTPGE